MCAARALAVLAGIFGFAGVAHGLVLEGFENPSAATVTGGQATDIAAGEGVTEGKHAAQIPAQATVSILTDGRKLAAAAWLKIDTLGAEPVPYSLGIRIQGLGLSYNTIAYVQPGKETVAMPLAPVASRRMEGWPDGEILIELKNLSKSPLILDNVRIEAPAKAPAEAVLLDFGPREQHVWPGFRPAGGDDVNLLWSGNRRPDGHSLGYPDPLIGDFIGPPLGYTSSDSVDLVVPGNKAGVAWLWITHYASRFTQPGEYAVKVAGKSALKKHLTATEWMGPAGYLEGKDGDWTPKWFDETYAEHFYELLKVDVPQGRARIDLANCQLAAMVLGPVRERMNLQEYVNNVNKELSAYRRQFVVGQRVENLCDLTPTPEDMDARVMVLKLPGGTYSPRWSPDDSSKIKTLRLRTCNGGIAAAMVAVVPLKETTGLTASLGDFRTEQGRTLAAATGKVDVWLLETVPRVWEGRVAFPPWVLTRRIARPKPREMVFLLAVVEPRESAVAGTYRGTLRLNLTAATANIPVELEIADIGRVGEGQREPAAGSMNDADAMDFLGAVAAAQTPLQRAALTAKLRQALMTDVLNALMMPAPSVDLGFNSNFAATTGNLTDQLRAYPFKQATGPTLFDAGNLASHLENRTWAGSGDYRKGVKNVVAKLASLTSGLPGGSYLYLGDITSDWNAAKQVRMAKEITVVGGKPIAQISARDLERSGINQRMGAKSAFPALIFVPDSKVVSQQIGEFCKVPGHKAYIKVGRPDRYAMGFYARAVGADGFYMDEPYGYYGGPYTGFWHNGRALMVPQAGGNVAPTLAMMALRLARDDYSLMERAEVLLHKAENAKVPAKELSDALNAIRSAASARELDYDQYLLRSTVADGVQLEAWRESLIKACAAVVKALEEKGKTK